MSNDLEILKRALKREKAARKHAEKILEEKSLDLYNISIKLKATNQKLEDLVDEKTSELAVIVENSSLGIVLTQYDTILQTNKAFQNLLGYTADELVLKKVKDISLKEEYTQSAEFLDKLNSGEINTFTVNKRYKKKDGSLVWAKTNVAAVRDHQNNAIKLQVALVEDITEHLALEEQRKQLLSNLEKNNQELKEYAQVVSHDLKSPLRSINALVNWLKEDYEDVLDQGALKNISLIEGTLEKMERLINGILNYSSIGNKNIRETVVDPNEVVTDIINTIYIPSHVTVHIINPLPKIKGDSIRIQQLFQNLISNAVSHIDKERGIVEINYEDRNAYHIFSIKDNGIGIKKEHFTRIFKIFQSLSSNSNSTGIGLSIVKKIIDLYEGDIWLDSTLGKGTTFYFSLKKEL